MHLKVIFLLVLFLVYHANSTLGPNDRKSKKSSKEPTKPVKSKPALETVSKEIQGIATVFERQLIKPNIMNTKEIIDNHATYCKDCRHLKNFQNKILGYVTPWNSKGYDLAKVFAKKMNMISPVWLQIQRKGRKKYELKGTHDIDQDWMKTVKENSQTEAGNHAEFLPRILFENLQPEDLHALFNNEEEAIALGNNLVNFIKIC
jgi:chitinase domain-containing protein 1